MARKFACVYEAKAQLARLIARAQDGEDVVIAQAGKPGARLVTWEASGSGFLAPGTGQVHMSDDFGGSRSRTSATAMGKRDARR